MSGSVDLERTDVPPKTSVRTRATWRYMPEDGIRHNHPVSSAVKWVRNLRVLRAVYSVYYWNYWNEKLQAAVQKTEINDRSDPLHLSCYTPHAQKSALASPAATATRSLIWLRTKCRRICFLFVRFFSFSRTHLRMKVAESEVELSWMYHSIL
jgi:hypothetical protein